MMVRNAKNNSFIMPGWDAFLCPLPIQVRITRLSAGELDDDNLRAALKSIRDGVADAFGTDDARSSRLKFEYAQEKCKRGAYVVRIQIE